jgi:hypothetical protein
MSEGNVQYAVVFWNNIDCSIATAENVQRAGLSLAWCPRGDVLQYVIVSVKSARSPAEGCKGCSSDSIGAIWSLYRTTFCQGLITSDIGLHLAPQLYYLVSR